MICKSEDWRLARCENNIDACLFRTNVADFAVDDCTVHGIVEHDPLKRIREDQVLDDPMIPGNIESLIVSKVDSSYLCFVPRISGTNSDLLRRCPVCETVEVSNINSREKDDLISGKSRLHVSIKIGTGEGIITSAIRMVGVEEEEEESGKSFCDHRCSHSRRCL